MCVEQHSLICAPIGALSFIAAPYIANRGTITEHTTHKNSHVAQICLHRSKHHAKEGQHAKVVTRLGVNKGWSKVNTWHKRNIDQLTKTTEHETLALFPYTPCVHQGDYKIKINMRFGLTEQHHDIKTNKHPKT